MINIANFKTNVSGLFSLHHVISVVLFCFFMCGVPVFANTGQAVSFLWNANPSQENVIGYRLYYGSSSRFNSKGIPKANFSYDYYIDSNDLTRCTPGGNTSSCKELSQKELDCNGLDNGFPTCTLSNLQGNLYFTLTAYDATTESDFTYELQSSATKKPKNPSPQASVAIPQIYRLLIE